MLNAPKNVGLSLLSEHGSKGQPCVDTAVLCATNTAWNTWSGKKHGSFRVLCRCVGTRHEFRTMSI